MAKAERNAALNKRRQAIAIIRNVRRTRRVLAAHPFDSKTFDAVNGIDHGLEQLVGHSVMFDSLDESERLSLRREINAKLFESEQKAFGVLRTASVEYFSELQKIIDRVDDVNITALTITHLNSNKKPAIEAFENFKLEEGALDCERCISTLEHLELMAEAVDENVPDMEGDLDHEEYTEEEHEHEDELPDDDDDETIEEEDDLDDETEDESNTNVDWIESEEAFLESAKRFTMGLEATMTEAGFDTKKAAFVVGRYPEVMKKYTTALQRVRDTVAAETCTAEQLLRGSKKFYNKIDKLVDHVEAMESLRDAFVKTCKGLTKVAHEMMLINTRDPML